MEKILYTTYTEGELEALFGRAISKYIPQQQIAGSRKWLTHAEAAVYASMTEAALYQKTSKKLINYHKAGKSNRYLIQDLDAFLNNGRIKTFTEIKNEVQLQPKKNNSLIKTK